jgi:hypothetical protein
MRPRQSPDLLVKMLPKMGRSPMRVATGWATRTYIRTGFRWSGRIPIEQIFQRLQCGLWRRRRVILPVCKDIAFSC